MLRVGLDGLGRACRRRGRPAHHLRHTQLVVEGGWGCAAGMAIPLSALRRGLPPASRMDFPHGTLPARPSSVSAHGRHGPGRLTPPCREPTAAVPEARPGQPGVVPTLFRPICARFRRHEMVGKSDESGMAGSSECPASGVWHATYGCSYSHSLPAIADLREKPSASPRGRIWEILTE